MPYNDESPSPTKIAARREAYPDGWWAARIWVS